VAPPFIRIGTNTGAEIVNGTAGVVPPDVVTVTLAVPGAALMAIVNVAVICVEFTTVMPLTVTPGLLTAIVAPVVKLVPIRVTPPADPVTPAEGLTALSVGGGAVTVNATAAVAPPSRRSLTSRLPSYWSLYQIALPCTE